MSTRSFWLRLAGLAPKLTSFASPRGGCCPPSGRPVGRTWAPKLTSFASLTPVAFIALAVWAVAAFSDLAHASFSGPSHGWVAIGVALVVLIAALVSSVAGFAFCAIAGCALAYLEIAPLRGVQMMVLCSIAIQLYAVWTIRDAIDWWTVRPMIIAGAVTVPVGVWLLVHVDGALYTLGLGAFLVAYGCHAAMRRESWIVRDNAWQDIVAGALGGIAGGLAGLPGSFVTIWCSMRGWDKLRQRAVYQPYILAMQIVAMICLRFATPSSTDFQRDLLYVPFALVGAVGGLAIFRRLTNTQFQRTVSVLLVSSGLGLIAHAL